MAKTLGFFLLLTFFYFSTPFDITCKFTFRSDPPKSNNSKIYSCIVNSSFASNATDSTLESVKGTHLKGKSNSDVLGFFVFGEGYEKIVETFPSNLSEFFPHLTHIFIQNANLQSIDTENLQNFTDLSYLFLYKNEIQRLESDLFKFNPKLTHITLESNKISFIDLNVFDDLKELKSLNLDRNKCISDDAMGSRTKVLNLIKKIKQKCFKKSEF